MAIIPGQINDVSIHFGLNVHNSVDPKLLGFLQHTIRPNIVNGPTLTSIYISSLKDQHNLPSRHMQGSGKAIDISRINGMRMSTHYPSDPTPLLPKLPKHYNAPSRIGKGDEKTSDPCSKENMAKIIRLAGTTITYISPWIEDEID
ncbi:MAG: hypothetical protein O9274_14015 [Limnobacter sp.]|uniref:hypothetical protein n=1 Tax=Limnobacter sp. TaxID=2003368 RepID=UPI0022C815F9|nr:hypothetical protein [Limnobacter sp.]MCZ8016814.1 hypothetical protein [Limnobacter sp.]